MYFMTIPGALPRTEMIRPVGAATTTTQRLARLSEQKHALLTTLKKSLLHQAFTGDLWGFLISAIQSADYTFAHEQSRHPLDSSL